MADITPTMPQSKSQPLPPDTLPRPRLASKSAYLSGDVLDHRAVLEELGKYLSVPYHTFVHSIFGSYQEVPQICQKLIDEGLLTVTADSVILQWTGFPTMPHKSNSHEGVAFQPLIDIISKIFEQVHICQVTCQATPYKTPLLNRSNTSCPDGFIAYKHPASINMHWWKIAIPFEFKKGTNAETTKDNEEKMIWSLHNIMREDPRRRFALGITIEDTDMRIWYINRALLAVSTPLKFMEEIDDVISLFHSIAVASKNEEQLGWDPTVERFTDSNGKVQYKFEIGGQLYTTTNELATYGADAMVGRATRVYKAKDEDGKVVAIKDSWRDHDRDMEGVILEKIFEDIKTKFGVAEVEEARKYFVQIRVSVDVLVSERRDETLEFKADTGGEGVSLEWLPVNFEPIQPKKPHIPSTGYIPDLNYSPTITRCKVGPPCEEDQKVPKRIHTRTVFEDVGTPLKDVTFLGDCFTCLSGALRALYFLHKAEWVHRDFSVTNVLWFEMDGIGKLTDLEHAKKFGSETTHDDRTGTWQFMAMEVESRRYLFIPEWNSSYPPPFHMNFLHDLESVLWAAVWILFHCTDADSPARSVAEQSHHFTMAFPRSITHISRSDFFKFASVRRQAFDTVASSYQGLYANIDSHAAHLRGLYREAEKSYPEISINEKLVERAHGEIWQDYSGIAEKFASTRNRLLFHGMKRVCEGSPTCELAKKSKLDN